MFTVHYLCRPYFSFKLLLLSPPGLFQLGIRLQINDLHASFGNSGSKLKSNLLQLFNFNFVTLKINTIQFSIQTKDDVMFWFLNTSKIAVGIL